ncbi:MAG: HNH endonuclease signature motif containing protein [Waterburya sp.]
MKANIDNDKFFLKLVQNGCLRVSKNGQVFNVLTSRFIGNKYRSNSYRKLSWFCHKTNKIWQIQLHRLVWVVFIGVIQDAHLQINHKDGDKANCALDNLELVTSSENRQHAVKLGLSNEHKGQARPNSKFSDNTVVILRKLFKNNKLTISDVVKKYDCSKTTAWLMLNSKTYKHV